YWSAGKYELYFELPPEKDTIQLLVHDNVPYIKLTLSASPPALSAFYVLPLPDVLSLHPDAKLSADSLLPLPELEDTLRLLHYKKKTTTAFTFYIAGILSLLF